MNQSTDIKSARRDAEFAHSAPIFCKFFCKPLAVSKNLFKFAMFKFITRCKNRRKLGFFYVITFGKIHSTMCVWETTRVCVITLNSIHSCFFV